MSLSLNEKQLFYQLSTELRIRDPQWLIDLVRFESNFNPKAKNPYSSARGLIQFIDVTARNLGYSDSLNLVNENPTIESQLFGPVKEYLKKYAPFDTESSLYMAVFFPAARKYPANTPFKKIFSDLYGSQSDAKYEAFIKANPGITSPQDYINRLKRKPIVDTAIKGGSFILIAAVLYFLYKKFTK